MFNVTRPLPAPECLIKNQYNHAEVVNLLEPMFYGKCYLCEQDALSDPEIEHFDPHENDHVKKFSWCNLFYACSRCNSIKSNTHKNLLDCSDSSINVCRAIKCVLPSIPNELITVTAMNMPASDKINNTVVLLDRCYNESQTALRGISRITLLDKIFEHYCYFIGYRNTLKNKKSSDDERKHAKGRIKEMLKAKFPFSIFWRWHLLSDDFLVKELHDLIDF
jgi:uncharacterized protein (TIGR02646 family)